MSDFETGYGKPPRAGQFKPGVSGNSNGRPKRKLSAFAGNLKKALEAPVKYQENGRTRISTRQDLAIRRIVEQAKKGDVAAAEAVLRLYEQAERYGDFGTERILVENWMPDFPGQTGDQKAHEARRVPDNSLLRQSADD